MENSTAIVVIRCSSDTSIWSILLSIAPIIVAIIAIVVPAIIAYKQNRIALYEKRFKCYKQFEAMKAFYVNVKAITSFNAANEKFENPTWVCQQFYFDAHSLFEDKEFQNRRLDRVYTRIYVNSCIESDREMLLSLKLLGAKKKEFEQISNAGTTLADFIKKLFEPPEKTNDNDEKNLPVEAAASPYFDELLMQKEKFVVAFETIMCLENRLEKLLKMKR